MVKLVVLFRRPRERAEQLAAEVMARALPQCRLIPGVSQIEVASTQTGVGWGRGDRRGPPFFMIGLGFEDHATCDAAIASSEGRKALSEILEISNQEVNIFLAEVRHEAIPPSGEHDV